MKSLDLFTGVGGIALALRDLGIEPAVYCERDPMAISVLRQRMRCGHLPPAPLHTDVERFPGKDYKGKIDVLCAGFPCFPAGTPVLTNEGYVPIETVSHDDLLLTHTGSWKPIENIQQKLYAGRMALVCVVGNPKIACTENHPFYARTLTNSTPEWVAARDLTPDHFVGIPYVFGSKVLELSMVDKMIDGGYMWSPVTVVGTYQPEEPLWVYNFQVQDDHSYVVQNVVVKNCTGFSAMKMNTKDAFNNPGSGLYRHVCRLIDEIQPPIVFLENVQGIRLEGLRFVAETLRSRGYDASWVSLRGFHVGAPQHRPRWFCLATHTKFKGATLTLKKPFTPYNWKKEPVGCPRLIYDLTLLHERASLLGNTVIPDMVRWSFLYLWTGSRVPYPKIFGSTSWTFAKPDPQKAVETPEENPPATGMILGQNRLGALPVPSGLLQLPASRARTLDPKKFTFEGPKNPINVLPSHTKPMNITTWATPRYSSTGCSRVLTNRTERDLPTQLRFAADTPEKQRAGQPNPEFLEWLLGLPRGWTNPNSREVLH